MQLWTLWWEGLLSCFACWCGKAINHVGGCQGAAIWAPSHPGRLALALLPRPGHESTWLSGFPASWAWSLYSGKILLRKAQTQREGNKVGLYVVGSAGALPEVLRWRSKYFSPSLWTSLLVVWVGEVFPVPINDRLRWLIHPALSFLSSCQSAVIYMPTTITPTLWLRTTTKERKILPPPLWETYLKDM